MPSRNSHSAPLALPTPGTATAEFYTLSLHDALPISADLEGRARRAEAAALAVAGVTKSGGASASASIGGDRKSTRLNSSHVSISYAVSCLKTTRNRPANHHPLVTIPAI